MERLKIRVWLCGLILLLTVTIKAQSTIEKIGDISLYSLPVVALSSTLINKDLKGTYMLAKASLLNATITFGLKELIDKERPNKENLNSFPSGHTSITFQNAAFMQKRYGWKYGIPAYVVAAYTGFSRVHVKKHFVEDVAAGAVIGVLSSYIFTKKKLKTTKTSFSFLKNRDELYVSYRYQF